jgi:hypothetical protein
MIELYTILTNTFAARKKILPIMLISAETGLGSLSLILKKTAKLISPDATAMKT